MPLCHLIVLLLQLRVAMSSSQISHPPDNIYTIDNLQPIFKVYVEGYNKHYFNFTLPWNVHFQNQGYRTLWYCTDGTLHFTRPIETYSPF